MPMLLPPSEVYESHSSGSDGEDHDMGDNNTAAAGDYTGENGHGHDHGADFGGNAGGDAGGDCGGDAGGDGGD